MAKIVRHPRLSVTTETRLNERILRRTYNVMRMSKEHALRKYGNYDLYKTKRGWIAEKSFKMLAILLAERKIDPAEYIKTMCRYGKYENSKYLPQPSWLAKVKTIDEIFLEWFYKKQRNMYELKSDWRRISGPWGIDDVYREIDMKSYQLKQLKEDWEGGLLAILEEFENAPWFLVAYLHNHPKAKRRLAKYLEFYHLKRNKEFRRLMKKRFKRSFSESGVL